MTPILRVSWPGGSVEQVHIADPELPVRIGHGQGSLTVQLPRGVARPLRVVIAGAQIPTVLEVEPCPA